MSEKRPFWHDLVAERPASAPSVNAVQPKTPAPNRDDTRLQGKYIQECLRVLENSAHMLEHLIKHAADDDKLLSSEPIADRLIAKMANLNKLTLTIDRFFFSVDTLTALVGDTITLRYHTPDSSLSFETKTSTAIKSRLLNKIAMCMGVNTEDFSSELALRLELEKVVARFGVERFKIVSASIVEDTEKSSLLASIPSVEATALSVGKEFAAPSIKLLPEKAPELYKGRANTSEDGPAFFNRVYKDHIGNGLTRAVLDKLDHPLVARIDTLKRNKDPAALALDLPTAYAGPQNWADRVLAGEETAPEVADVKTHTRNRMRIAKARERAATKSR